MTSFMRTSGRLAIALWRLSEDEAQQAEIKEQLSAFFKQTFEMLEACAKKVLDFVLTTLREIFGDLGPVLTFLVGVFQETFTALVAGVKQFITAGWTAVWELFLEVIGSLLDPRQDLSQAITSIREYLEGMWGNLKGLDLSGANQKLKRIQSTAIGMIDSVGLYLYFILLALPSALGSIFGPAGTTAGATLGQTLNTTVSLVLAGVDVLLKGEFAVKDFNDLKALFQEAKKKLLSEGITQPVDDQGKELDYTLAQIMFALPEEKQEEAGEKGVNINMTGMGSSLLIVVAMAGSWGKKWVEKILEWLDEHLGVTRIKKRIKTKFVAPKGPTFVSTPNGKVVRVPEGWVGRTADNGKGIVYQRPGASGNADMIRIMDPTPQYPNGYMRYYNSHGQPLDVLGKPGPNSATHIPLDYQGELPAWPQ